ncbi:endo-1,4-beta-xylanase [Halomonas sp. M20]|uniref:endo-1,4-beta-xylanase n=1 Tax=Halomonas sp. M20 TaxID=2763264 RepID=UPI001D0A348D|nr:endo-1,4-beta-xylanase [Halomonas sp. M20]
MRVNLLEKKRYWWGHAWKGLACIALVALGTGCVNANDKVELLDKDWTHLAGAEMVDEGVRIEGLGRAIVPTDDADDQTPVANPPINLRGPVLRVKGDFALSARLSRLESSPDDSAYLTIYGELPLTQDEWRQDGRAVTLGLEGNDLIVELQNGIDDYERHAYPLPASAMSQGTDVSLARIGDRFSIRINDETVALIDDPGLFDSGVLWFGASASEDGEYLLQSLTARPLDRRSEVTIMDNQIPVLSAEEEVSAATSLRHLAEKNHPRLYIGTAVAAIPLLSDKKYARILAREFSMVTPENAMKFQFIHPGPDSYAFADADAIVDFAQANDMAIHGHTLAWKEALPRWVTGSDYTDQQLKDILAKHIAKVVGRYKGRVQSWDVVNEPFEPFGATLRTGSPWYQSMGKDYIAFALREAHRADPEARLYINDYALEHPGPKSDAMHALAKSLLERGVPLHGIGFQMHEDMTDDYQPVEASVFRDNVQRFIDLGLEVRISEMDVNLQDNDSQERLQQQAEYYRSILELAMDIPAFTAFSTWGFTDRYSSLQEWWEADGFGNGLIFDANHQPKPAYFSLQEALKE